MIRRSVLSLAVAAGLLSPVSSVASEALKYRVRYPGSTPARLSVSLEVPKGLGGEVFLMPRAIPMGYAEQAYADFVGSVEAFDRAGARVEVERGKGPRWNLRLGDQALARVTYEVDLGAMEEGILDSSAASKVRAGYLGALGYSIFGYLEGTEERPVQLEIRGPENWPVFSTLNPKAAPDTALATATARNFYELADSQVTMGPALEVLEVEGHPGLFVVGYAEAPWDIGLTGLLGRQALDALIAYFGSAPFADFTMVLEILLPLSEEHEYGFSMEHLGSATFFLGPAGALTESSPSNQRRRNLYNYAHHIAHAWIPKRCAGSGYFPFDWEFAPVLDSIWFSEGFGQYAAGVALAETMDNGEEFLDRLIEMRFESSLANAPASIRRMSTVELSRVASTRYGSDFRLGRNLFSRGALMAAEMDATIRAESGGRKSLRDGFRHLLAWTRDHGTTLPMGDFAELLEKATGVDVSEIYRRWLAPQAD